MPKIVGPVYSLVAQPPDNKVKGNAYCENYFVLEAATAWGPAYLAFHYRDEEGAMKYEEVPMKDITLVTAPDPQPSVAPAAGVGTLALPNVTRVGEDGGQYVWILRVTKTMEITDSLCLQGVPRQ
jgi:hypothetical protein